MYESGRQGLYIQRFRVRWHAIVRPSALKQWCHNRCSSIPGTHTHPLSKASLHLMARFRHAREDGHDGVDDLNRLDMLHAVAVHPATVKVRHPGLISTLVSWVSSDRLMVTSPQSSHVPSMVCIAQARWRHNRWPCRPGMHVNHCPAYCRLRSYTRLHLYNLRMK